MQKKLYAKGRTFMQNEEFDCRKKNLFGIEEKDETRIAEKWRKIYP